MSSSNSTAKGSASSSNAAHLARVRENQRRSRARRKEYLADLEDRFRKCNERGVEASAEMQLAARRVLEENQRLRMILRAQGMSDHDIDAFALGTSPPPSAAPPSPAVADLDNMLGRSVSSATPEPGRGDPTGLGSTAHDFSVQQPGGLSPGGTQTLPRRRSHQPQPQAPAQGAVFPTAFSAAAAPAPALAVYSPLATGFPGASSGVDSQYQGYGPNVNLQAPRYAGPPAPYDGFSPEDDPNREHALGDTRSGGDGSGLQGFAAGEVDMSELLSPELQAQFTAALGERAPQTRQDFEGTGQGEQSWHYERKW